jgi:hypothetical protein
VPNANNETAIFGDATTVPRVVFTENDVTVRTIQFDHDVTYAVAGVGSVNLESASVGEGINAGLSVLQGSHQFQAVVNVNSTTDVDVQSGASIEFINRLNLNGNKLTKTGNGSMIVSNTLNTGGGTLDCQQGTCGGSGTIGGDVHNSGGIISPGSSAGVLGITADSSVLDGGETLAVVPEPATLTLVALAVLAWISGSRTGRISVGRWM